MRKFRQQQRFATRPVAVAILVAMTGAAGLNVYAVELDGKRLDNARIENRGVTAPVEWQPGFSYPLPSGVTRGDADAMRNNTEPADVPQATESLSEDALGALFESGKADLLPGTLERLDALVSRYRDKDGLRVSVVGHTDSQRMNRATAAIFTNNQGLSEARALAVANYLRSRLDLPTDAFSISGKGKTEPVAPNDTRQGMARNRRVELRFWYDVAPAVAAPAVLCAPGEAQAELPFRVTVDGEPIQAAEGVNEADRQRCTDVALERANLQIAYDSLADQPALNVWTETDVALRGEPVNFRGWTNYAAWVHSAEVRIFNGGDDTRGTPLATVPLHWEQPASWQVPAAGNTEYTYVLRVYDDKGRFDETALKQLNVASDARPLKDLESAEREALTGWGENALSMSNIPVRGGTVTISGRDLQPGSRVEALGLPVPVGANGRFAMRQILPGGPHSLAVTVIDASGEGATYHRNVSIPVDDWFYIAVGDITVGRNNVTGPAQLVTGDDQHYDKKTYIDGRGAFYLKGKVKGDWLLTAAADTREQPLKHLFSNFASKDPRYLLRNIDPDAYYPVYGDDSTTAEDAPTQGKFYVRLEKGDSHVMWGNFHTSWSGSELVQYSRGLYGGRAMYRSEGTTSFGERKTFVEAFAADPGTLGAREEFRGTGGSLYYLRQQDLTVGSEQLWIEVRDRDSDMVVERHPLVPAQDYEINYLQGRIMLNEALPSTASGVGLVRSSALSGNPVYLVATYEYVPGLTKVDTVATGVRASQWIGEHLQVGVTGYHQGKDAAKQTLRGIDVTARATPGTSIKLEVARSTGSGDLSMTSLDGGFGFDAMDPTASGRNTGHADARRVEAQMDLADIADSARGKLSGYWQDKDAGFSGPGQISWNGEAIRQAGAQGEVMLGERNKLTVKVDDRRSDSQIISAAEVDLSVPLGREWTVSAGVRRDDWETRIPNASPTLSQDGVRTDIILMADYAPLKDDGKDGEKADWNAYAFVQGTAQHTGTRDVNNRIGVGGKMRVTDRLSLSAEASHGNLGVGGALGADYRISDRSNAYLNYRLETENPDLTYRGRHGTWVSGVNYRVNDAVRLFGETRVDTGSGPQSLIQAFGVDLSPNDRWSFGGKMEFGKVSDRWSGDMKRSAVGLSVGYKYDKVKYAGMLEFRNDRSDGGTYSGMRRRTWLMRNTLGYQVDPSWRLLGKFNYAHSSNTQGAFYDGNFREIVLGAAYRPIDNDRWNTLFKYTNFYNVPSPGQLAPSGSVADYQQKSQVLSVDTIWDARPWVSLGAKYGLRIGKLKDQKVGGNWYSSRADLVILRADFHVVREWDALVEWRNLRVREARDSRSGVLLGVYRHVGNHVKVGVGYNFTDYSDDLTDLSYRSRGWFINVLGTF